MNMTSTGIGKRIIKDLHPKQILAALDEIDANAPSYTLNRPQALRRVFVVLACISVCLLIIHYLKYSSVFVALLQVLSETVDKPSHYLYQSLTQTGFVELITYAWWAACHVLGYVLIPALVIKRYIKLPLADFGWRWNNTSQHWAGYILLLSPILLFVVIAASNRDFVAHYPFYRLAGRSWFDFLAWECLYLGQFICLEFFFRGFFLQALRPAVGANAVWIMCVPYLMIHFPKLWPEAGGAILFGLLLGILALRSASIWGGFFVHAGVAVGMDVASLLKQGNIPKVFWPF
ncbi:type II CAAX prenyl endopeptidase Rce1 family protein [Zhongshania sp.]|uniref:CPBP family glutamic-type intramembrane protease n=1 Tax=Zhongshania sp. TaxID=1971902 RepID=UPI00356901B8